MRPPIPTQSVPYTQIIFVLLLSLLLASFTLWPDIDLQVSSWFYQTATGFPAAKNPLALAIHEGVFWGARLLALGLLIGLILAVILRRTCLGLKARAWLLLLLALIIGPGIVANEVFKDNWGRARPHQITEFGGAAQFTPPLVMVDECARNCSFVSGDASFGFFLTVFAFVVPALWRRRVFWSGFAAGIIFGANRIMMGGHFLSDVIYAGIFMLIVNIVLFRIIFGTGAWRDYWKNKAS